MTGVQTCALPISLTKLGIVTLIKYGIGDVITRGYSYTVDKTIGQPKSITGRFTKATAEGIGFALAYKRAPFLMGSEIGRASCRERV